MLENKPPNSSRKHDQDKGVEKNVTMSAVRAPDQLKILADTDETWLQVSTAERARWKTAGSRRTCSCSLTGA